MAPVNKKWGAHTWGQWKERAKGGGSQVIEFSFPDSSHGYTVVQFCSKPTESWMWPFTPLCPALRRQKQTEFYMFKASWIYRQVLRQPRINKKTLSSKNKIEDWIILRMDQFLAFYNLYFNRTDFRNQLYSHDLQPKFIWRMLLIIASNNHNYLETNLTRVV